MISYILPSWKSSLIKNHLPQSEKQKSSNHGHLIERTSTSPSPVNQASSHSLGENESDSGSQKPEGKIVSYPGKEASRPSTDSSSAVDSPIASTSKWQRRRLLILTLCMTLSRASVGANTSPGKRSSSSKLHRRDPSSRACPRSNPWAKMRSTRRSIHLIMLMPSRSISWSSSSMMSLASFSMWPEIRSISADIEANPEKLPSKNPLQPHSLPSQDGSSVNRLLIHFVEVGRSRSKLRWWHEISLQDSLDTFA